MDRRSYNHSVHYIIISEVRNIKKIFDEELFQKLIKVTDGMELEQQKILILMMEYTQWKNGIVDYLARHNKKDMWKWYKRVIPTIPDHLQLMLFMEVIYTQQDKISRKQYSYFKRWRWNEK